MTLQGQTVILVDRIQTGVDGFRRPIWEDVEIPVENVLIAPVSDAEILDTLNLTGHKPVYQLAIPKGDENHWTDRKVRFFGETWKVIGEPMQGIDELIPMQWNGKVKVERNV